MNLKLQRNLLIIAVMLLLFSHLVYGIEEAAQMGAMEQKLERQEVKLQDKQEQIEMLELIIEHQDEETEPETKEISLGKFTITHYCPCEICCGKSDGITFTGTRAVEGRTIAVDPDVIPLGSKVIIDGQEYIAEDIGGAIKNRKLDIFVSDHQKALTLGKTTKDVYLVE